MHLTDAPLAIDPIQRVDVFVARVDGRQADADSATAGNAAADDSVRTGGWTTLASPNRSINLLDYQGGQTLLLGQASVPEGSYRGFRLVIDPSKSGLTLKNGQVLTGTSSPNVSFPSGSRSGIKIVLTQPVTVGVDSTTTMVVDFDVANSFVLRGNSMSLNGLPWNQGSPFLCLALSDRIDETMAPRTVRGGPTSHERPECAPSSRSSASYFP